MKKYMGLILLIVGGLSAMTFGADLHFIVLADTLAEGIGTEDDLDNAQSWAQDIADNTGLRLVFRQLSGNNLTIDQTRNLLSNLQVASDDVVYFYYSGHGGNPGDSIWPTLYFTSSTSWGDEVSFDEVVETLRPKNPRLLIVMTDCCNSYMDSGYPAFRPLPFGSADQQSFRHLFLDFQGTVLVTGCAPGEYSLGGPGQGGVFSYNFMESFYDLARSGQMVTWETLLARTAEETAKESALDDNAQHPQYDIEGGLVAAGTPDDDTDDDIDDDDDGWDDDGWDDDDMESSTGGCGAAGMAPMALTLLALGWPMYYRRHRRERVR